MAMDMETGVLPMHRGIEASELADLMESFNQVTARLEQTHCKLRDEVGRLQRELHAANEELERSRRLAALGEMAAGIAHEVRNPLGSIGLYAEMLVTDLVGQREQQILAERIGGAVRGLDAIVNDVLVCSRELRVHAERVPASQLVDEAIARCADLCAGGHTPTITRMKSNGHLLIEVDAALVVQALTNIVRNAIEAASEEAPDGGGQVAIDVRTSAEFAGEHGTGPMVMFRVEDSGPGISEEVLERMFNPFFTTRAAGTGLGLPIVHRIVEAHNGRVCVSRGGQFKGACFDVLLPMDRVNRAGCPEA